MPLNLYYTFAARQDLKDIWRYGARIWGEDRTEAYLLNLETQMNLLCVHPEAGAIKTEYGKGIRTFPALEHILVYRIQNETLEIVRIAHAKSDYAQFLI